MQMLLGAILFALGSAREPIHLQAYNQVLALADGATGNIIDNNDAPISPSQNNVTLNQTDSFTLGGSLVLYRSVKSLGPTLNKKYVKASATFAWKFQYVDSMHSTGGMNGPLAIRVKYGGQIYRASSASLTASAIGPDVPTGGPNARFVFDPMLASTTYAKGIAGDGWLGVTTAIWQDTPGGQSEPTGNPWTSPSSITTDVLLNRVAGGEGWTFQSDDIPLTTGNGSASAESQNSNPGAIWYAQAAATTKEVQGFWSFSFKTNTAAQSTPGVLSLSYAMAGGKVGMPYQTARITLTDPSTGGTIEVHSEPSLKSGSFNYIPDACSGTYDVKLVVTGALQKAVRSVTTATNTINTLNYNLTLGDVNGDNSINSLDVSAVQSKIGKTSAEDDWEMPDASGIIPAVCDLNGDGIVDASDVAIVNSHYGMNGD